MSLFDRLTTLLRRRLPAPAATVDSRPAVDFQEPEWVAAADRRGQRVVFADWVGLWTIDDAGTPYFAERVDLADQIAVIDRREVNLARFRAATRYPDLAHLRPKRAPDDYECPSCHGTGVLPLPPETAGRIWCFCGGLGWLPAGYPDPAQGDFPSSGGAE